MQASEMRNLNKDELEKNLKSLKEEFFNLRFQHAINQLDNPMRLKSVKKDIARTMTVLREIELKAQKI